MSGIIIWFVLTTCWQGYPDHNWVDSWQTFPTKEEAVTDAYSVGDSIIVNCKKTVYKGNLTEVKKEETP